VPRIYENESNQKNRWVYFIPAVIWISLVVILSLLPQSSVSKYQWWHFQHSDKVIHAGIYAVMAVALLYGFQGARQGKAKQYFYTLVFCLLIGIFLEGMQQTKLIGRHFEILDIIANIIGALLGSVLFLKIHKYLTHGSRN
jgi:VanZ family protein